MNATARARPDGSAAVMIFAKAPVAGQAKTRLIPAMGARGAARLSARLTWRTLETAERARIGPVQLWCAPDATHPFFAACASRLPAVLREQGGGDLGARMGRAFACALRDHRHAVLAGSDCPGLEAADFAGAQQALDECDAALVPAHDGGYVLIALRRFDASLFEAVSWGGAAVMEQTRARMRALRWRWRELPARADIDRPEDLARLPSWALAPTAAVDAAKNERMIQTIV